MDDDALATLPRFTALHELTPMDVHDDAFRHVGACKNLRKLYCMYCRTTGDDATEAIAGLTTSAAHDVHEAGCAKYYGAFFLLLHPGDRPIINRRWPGSALHS